MTSKNVLNVTLRIKDEKQNDMTHEVKQKKLMMI